MKKFSKLNVIILCLILISLVFFFLGSPRRIRLREYASNKGAAPAKAPAVPAKAPAVQQAVKGGAAGLQGALAAAGQAQQAQQAPATGKAATLMCVAKGQKANLQKDPQIVSSGSLVFQEGESYLKPCDKQTYVCSKVGTAYNWKLGNQTKNSVMPLNC
jgi:hypothetical protein